MAVLGQQEPFRMRSRVTEKGRSRTFRPRGPGAGESVARHCPDEALHFGLVVVVVHAGADERVQSARAARARVASGTRGRGVHRGAPVARLARRFAVNLES